MNDEKTKKLPSAVKFTIVMAVLAVIFLILSIVSAEYSVSRTVSAIEAIGVVEFNDESKEKIDLARSYYNGLDKNLDLDQKISNADELTSAEFEYVRLAIKRAYLADKNGESEELVSGYVVQAREIFSEYCSTGECKNVSNYDDLTALEAKYSTTDTLNTHGGSTAPANSGAAGEIELC